MKTNTDNFILQSDGDINIQFIMNKYNLPINDQIERFNAYLTSIPDSKVNLVDEIKNEYDIEIYPNDQIQISGTPNDPDYSNQWGHDTIGVTDIWFEETGSRSIKVAILDTGIDYEHDDLKNNYLPVGRDFFNDDSDPMDDNGHGTHVAGIVGASINNSIGISGIANVSIFTEKILGSSGSGNVFDAAKAIYHAVDVGADIINNSWGSTTDSSILKAAIEHAIANGVVVVAASGNDGGEIKHYPAAYDGVIAVGATDINDNHASYSNYGDWVDISAPGSFIYSTLPDNNYGYKSGTSMATPYVTGGLTLLLSKANNTDIINQLLISTQDLGETGYDVKFGWGRLDLNKLFSPISIISPKTILPENILINSSNTAIINLQNRGKTDVTDITIDLLINGASDKDRQYFIPYLPSQQIKNIEIPFKIGAPDTYTIKTEVSTPDLESTFSTITSVEVGKIGIIQVNNEENLGGLEVYYENNGYIVTTITKLPDTLQSYDMLFIGEQGSSWNTDDLQKIEKYLHNGGTISVIADSNNANFDWISNYGISFAGSGAISGITSAIETHSLTNGISSMYFEFPSDYLVIDNALPLVNDTSDNPIIAISNQVNLIVISEDLETYTTNQDNEIFLDNLLTNNFHPNDLSLDLNMTDLASVGTEENISLNITNVGTQLVSNGEYRIYINNSLVQSDVFSSISPSNSIQINYPWTPSSQNIFNITTVISTTNDSYLFNNIKQFEVSTFPIENYTTSVVDQNWMILENPKTHEFNVDDDYLIYELPHYFSFYGKTYSTISIHSNGYISLGSKESIEFFKHSLSEFNGDLISPYLDDLIIDSNIFIESNYHQTAIEFNSVKNIDGSEIGSFQVILYANGSIQFNYALEQVTGEIGLISSYSQYWSIIDKNKINQNSSILFTPNSIQDDLTVAIKTNDFNRIDAISNFSVSILNSGKSMFQDINVLVKLRQSVLFDDLLTINANNSKQLNFSITLQNNTELPIYVEISGDTIIGNNKLNRSIVPYNGLIGILSEGNRDRLPLIQNYYSNNDYKIDFVHKNSNFNDYDVIFVGSSAIEFETEIKLKLIDYLYWNGQVVVIADDNTENFSWMKDYGMELKSMKGTNGVTSWIMADPINVGISKIYFDNPSTLDADYNLINDNNQETIVGRSQSLNLIGIAEDFGILSSYQDNSILLDNLVQRTYPSNDINIKINSSTKVLAGKTMVVNIEVRNIGEQIEENIEIQVNINGSLVEIQTLDKLLPGSSYINEIDIYIPESGMYVITGSVTGSDENEYNNMDTLFVQTKDKSKYRPFISGNLTTSREIGDPLPIVYHIFDTNNYNIEVYLNDSFIDFISTDSTFYLKIDLSDLDIGNYNLTIFVKDVDGLFFHLTTIIEIIEDTTPPLVNISGTKSFEIGTIGNILNINIHENNLDNMTVRSDNETIFTTVQLQSEINIDNLGYGNNLLNILVYDIYGNTYEDVFNIKVVDTVSPILKEYIQTNHSNTVLLRWLLFDQTPDTYWISDSNQNITFGSWSNTDPITIEISYDNLEKGLEFNAVDKAGNVFSYNMTRVDQNTIPSVVMIISGSLVSIVMIYSMLRYRVGIMKFLKRKLEKIYNN